MPTLPIYQVDAFTDRLFGGNPAAVCLLDGEWPSDSLLLSIAAENNLSETAFVLGSPGDRPLPLRWFTPREEVPLCGHATLAAAFVILEEVERDSGAVTFESMSGPLTVRRAGGRFTLEFPPVEMVRVATPPSELSAGLGVEPVELWETPADPNYLAILDSPERVRYLAPDLGRIETLHPRGVVVTAAGGAGADFVSRYFAPGYGIPEDPVTGSIHCALGPFWASRMGRRQLRARQLSDRGGTIELEVVGDRVELTGDAVLYMKGEIEVP